jgi:hypothetical protein
MMTSFLNVYNAYQAYVMIFLMYQPIPLIVKQPYQINYRHLWVHVFAGTIVCCLIKVWATK